MQVFILTCERCNGEYGTETHVSVHSSMEKAKEFHLTVVDQEDFKIANTPEEPGMEIPDYYNKWTDEHCYEDNIIKFQTGNWGFVVWQIRTIEVDGPPQGRDNSWKDKE